MSGLVCILMIFVGLVLSAMGFTTDTTLAKVLGIALIAAGIALLIWSGRGDHGAWFS